ncbi:hypothetical protein D3C80_1809660 [compost metagenome]
MRIRIPKIAATATDPPIITGVATEAGVPFPKTKKVNISAIPTKNPARHENKTPLEVISISWFLNFI